MTTDIETVTTALADFDKVAAGLAALTKTYGGVLYDVQTTSGMEAAKLARQAVRKPRYEIEAIRKGAKAPLLAIGKRLDSEAARITVELMKLEEPIDAQIKAEEGRKEREKAERAAAELARVQGIHSRIDALRSLPIKAANRSPEQIAALIAEAEAIVIDDSYAEFIESARQAHASSVAALRGLHGMAVQQEAEQARIVAERAELVRLRAEQDARNAVEQARQDEERRVREAEDRKAQEAREQEAARVAAELQAERDRLDAIKREQEATARAESERLAAERAAFEREQEAAREAAKPKPAPVSRPTDAELIRAVAQAFSVDDAIASGWLATFGAKKRAA